MVRDRPRLDWSYAPIVGYMPEQHPARRLLPLMLACVLLCVLALGAVLFLRPRSFTSHEEAIGYVLEQHDVAYKQISLAQTRLDTLNFYSYGRYSAPYGAGVTVQLTTGRRVNGRLECQNQTSSCYLYLSEVGITNELVPELTTTAHWRPLDWLWAHLPQTPPFVRQIPMASPSPVP